MALRHLVEQRRNLATLGRAITGSLSGTAIAGPHALPGPVFGEESLGPPPWLVREYARLVGADPSQYKSTVPPHLFPQWSFATLALAFESSGFPLVKVVNAGCTLHVLGEIAQGAPLTITSQLVRVEEKERHVLLTADVTTACGTDALRAECRALVPRRAAPGSRTGKAGKPAVPHGATEVARLRFPADAGLRFAQLTGDFNPIHWSTPYARLMGFPRKILHGFGSFAWSYEAFVKSRLSGNAAALRTFEARFTRPIPLPGSASLFVGPGNALALGDAPGGAAYMQGSYEA